jgi:hypothetical protein
MDIDDDFEQVGHSGGKITFSFVDQNGQRAYSLKFENAKPHACALFAIYALLPQGIPVTTLRMSGIGAPLQPPPTAGCLMVLMGSDREGFFGRSCLACRGHFRTQSAPEKAHCPYCGLNTATHQFLTEAHRKYVHAFTERFLAGYESGEQVTIDLDLLGEEVQANTAPLSFTEQRQQTRFTCSACRVPSDIMGRYGYCPACGRRNSFAVVTETLDALEDRVHNPRYPDTDRNRRDAEWRNLVRDCVSAFEGYSRDLLQELAQLPASPSRKRAVADITFHNPIQAALAIRTCFDIDLLNGLGQDDQEFLRRRFLRRHVYEHASGLVDQEYIDRSGDATVRVGQLLRERSGNVLTLIGLVRTLAKNFDEGFHSIQ